MTQQVVETCILTPCNDRVATTRVVHIHYADSMKMVKRVAVHSGIVDDLLHIFAAEQLLQSLNPVTSFGRVTFGIQIYEKNFTFFSNRLFEANRDKLDGTNPAKVDSFAVKGHTNRRALLA